MKTVSEIEEVSSARNANNGRPVECCAAPLVAPQFQFRGSDVLPALDVLAILRGIATGASEMAVNPQLAAASQKYVFDVLDEPAYCVGGIQHAVGNTWPINSVEKVALAAKSIADNLAELVGPSIVSMPANWQLQLVTRYVAPIVPVSYCCV